MRNASIIASFCMALASLFFLFGGLWYVDLLMILCSSITGCIGIIILQAIELSDLKKDKEFADYMNNNGL